MRSKINKHGKLRIDRVYELDGFLKYMLDRMENKAISHFINYNNSLSFEEREYLSLRYKDYVTE